MRTLGFDFLEHKHLTWSKLIHFDFYGKVWLLRYSHVAIALLGGFWIVCSNPKHEAWVKKKKKRKEEIKKKERNDARFSKLY